jgi:hypothetical protein
MSKNYFNTICSTHLSKVPQNGKTKNLTTASKYKKNKKETIHLEVFISIGFIMYIYT